MGASNFSGQFALNPDYFDGQDKLTRDDRTSARPGLYELLKELSRQVVKTAKEAADGAAATATAERPFYKADTYTKSIQAVYFLPAAALTADNTNNAVITVRTRNADGTLGQIVAQLTTNVAAGNWVAFSPVAIPLSDGTNSLSPGNAGLDLKDGQSLTVAITKGGTGVVVPAGEFEVILV